MVDESLVKDIIYYLVGYWYYEDYTIEYGDSNGLFEIAKSMFEKTFEARYGMTYDEYLKRRVQ